MTRTPQPTANPAHTRFLVTTSEGPLRSRFLVLATGGLSLPKTGSDGGGYSLATALGHSLVPRTPALVPLLLGGGFHAPLSGIAQEVELSVVLDGRRDCLLRGAMLWTHFGVSGPVILDASRHWHAARLAGREVSLRVSFLPGLDFAAAEAWLLDAARQQPRAQIAGVLAQRLPARVAAALAEAANESAHTPADSRQHAETPGARAARADETGPGLAPRADAPFSQTPMAHLTREQRRALLHTLLEWDLPVRGCRGYAYAEVTAGGVPLDEIDPATMASRKCPGLFLVGEILDVDGRIGGFNFQWAWSGGTAAAAGIAPLLIDHNTG